jgi:hypothetical protein
MRNRRLNAVSAVQTKSRPIFQVLVVYEDFAAGRRANETCSFLLSQLGDEFELRCGMWKFEILRNARLAEMAAAKALEADVIIVAVHESSLLPVEVTSWINHWLPLRDGRTAALIALIDGAVNPTGVVPPVCACLQKVAAAASMDFFPHIVGLRDEPPAKIRFPGGDTSAHLDESMPRRAPERHWGINE